jgi:hypothetical protein
MSIPGSGDSTYITLTILTLATGELVRVVIRTGAWQLSKTLII